MRLAAPLLQPFPPSPRSAITPTVAGPSAAAPLTPELIAGIISADLIRRGVQAPGRMPSLSDQGWLDLVHSTYYVPVSTATQ